MFILNSIFIVITTILQILVAQEDVGDLCTLQSTGSSGICKIINDCPQAIEDLKKHLDPQRCGFQGVQPIVCCPKNELNTTVSTREIDQLQRVPGDISLQKCEEYSKYVKEHKKPPVLLISAPNIEKNECGHKVIKLIDGGKPAGRKEFPHMAAIGYEIKPSDIRWLCGGTIISEQYILTAGHCLNSTEFGPSKYVLLGVTNLNHADHRQQLAIAERIPHPKYRSNAHYDDIGLLKLERPAKLSSYARPACLYSHYVITAEKAIATGWGSTGFAGITSNELLKVTLDFFTYESCNQSYKNYISRKLKRGIIDETQVCAGSNTDEEKDTCRGDSGGPLQIYHVNDDIKCMYDIVGVISFGKPCGASFGVYTRVSYYLKWIEDIVWPL